MNFLLLNQKYFEKIMCRKREKISIKFNYFPPAINLKDIDSPTADTPSQMLELWDPDNNTWAGWIRYRRNEIDC